MRRYSLNISSGPVRPNDSEAMKFHPERWIDMILKGMKFRGLVICYLIAALILILPSVTYAAKAKPNPRYAALVMDANTGEILHQSNADKILHPASLTKMMTLLLVFDQLQTGKLSLRDPVPISRHAADMVPSKIGLPAGSTIKVEDAILSVVTKSANDISVALAEKVGGSEYAFARLMTAKAREIGMNRTIFRNASGLHDEGQITTARDMAKLGRVLIQQYPQYYKYFSTKNFTYRGKSYHNHNRLMSTYEGMDGLKTGYIEASGFNLVASAVRDNRRLIGVVFGGRTAVSRNDRMAALLDEAFGTKSKAPLIAQSPDIPNLLEATSTLAALDVPVKAPVPNRKPPMVDAIAAISNQINPASGASKPTEYKWSSLNSAMQKSMFGKTIGQGDYDIDNPGRIETGMVAVNAMKGNAINPGQPATTAAPLTMPDPPRLPPVQVQPVSVPPNAGFDQTWSIQVGAFTSRAATDDVLHRSRQILPPPYSHAKAIIAPLKTGDGWLFRARFTGFNRTDAIRACGYIQDCLLIAPNT